MNGKPKMKSVEEEALMDLEVSRILIDWYETHKRALPWRETTDPYLIWVSEIILQQTRVAQGLDYFLRFTERFPTVQALAYAFTMDMQSSSSTGLSVRTSTRQPR